MIRNPRRWSLITVIVAFCVMMLLAFYINMRLQNRYLSTYDSLIIRWVTEYNRTLYNTFFEYASYAYNYRNLNYYTLAEMFDTDQMIDGLLQAGFVVYDVNGNTIFSHRTENYHDYISDDTVFSLIKEKLVLNEPSIITTKSQTKVHTKLAVAPVISRNYKHHISLVYIYDIDSIIFSKFGLNIVNITGFVLFLILMGTISLTAFYYKSYLNNIEDFLRFSIINKNQKNPHKLYYVHPFDKLETNIAFIIASRNDVETQYSELTEKFEYLVSLTSEGLVMEDEHGFIYFCNKKFADILGYIDDSELIGMRFTDFFFDKDDVEHYLNDVKMRHLKSTYSYKLKLISKTGQQKDCTLSGSVLYNDDGSIAGYYSAIADISDFIHLTQSQSEHQRIRNEFYEHNQNPMLILDENDNIIDVNESFINYVNKNKSALIGKPFERAIAGMEIENTYTPGIRDFEFYEPVNNEWYAVTIRDMNIDLKVYKLIIFYIVGHMKNQLPYHKAILTDAKGFFFIINRQNQILYISPSFTKLTNNSEVWFKTYYASLINNSKTKTLNLFETMTITQGTQKYEFTVSQLYTNNTSLVVYHAVLK